MKPVVLFRKSLQEEGEFEICQKYFQVVEQRTECKNQLVIARYSALPYYLELERDLANQGCCLLNTYWQHRWVADFEYYNLLRDYTPESWDDRSFSSCQFPGPFVVKGKTNSRKHQWNKLMFATDKCRAVNIAADLMHDSMIGEQGVIYRKYVPLKTFEFGIDGLPFSNEHRLFFYKDTLLSHGYYWAIAEDVNHDLDEEGLEFGKHLASIVSEYVNFFVLDIAETEQGEWILIEINDGQMSGLSMNDPHQLYQRLRDSLVT